MIGQGLRLAVIGVVLGLVAAAAATTLVRGLLFNTSATDPVVYALAGGVAAGDGRIGMLCSG